MGRVLEIKGWSPQNQQEWKTILILVQRVKGQIMRSTKGCNHKQRSWAETTWVKLIQTLQYKQREGTVTTLCFPLWVVFPLTKVKRRERESIRICHYAPEKGSVD